MQPTVPAPAAHPVAPEVCIKVRAFLTMRPAECTTGASLEAQRGLILRGRDTSGQLAGDLCVRWLGTDAVQFLKDHHEELKPGRALDIEIYGVKAAESELRGHVKRCDLAPLPPSWVKHAEKANHAPAEAAA
jgi:hypothetical protein